MSLIDIFYWILSIAIGIIVALVTIALIQKLVLKEKKINFHILSTVGIVLTALGIVFIANFNRIMKFFGVIIPIDTDPIKPTDLKTIIEQQREKVKKEKQNELEKKTPDDIINTELPNDVRTSVQSDIDKGKNSINDLFDRTRVDSASRENKAGS